MLPAKM